MGAWGYEALDSDGALDWLHNEVSDHAEKRIMATLASARSGADVQEELRAAGFVLRALNFIGDDDLWAGVAEQLKLIRDSDWPDEFDEPREVRKAMDEEITALAAGPRSTTLIANLLGEEA